MRSSEKMKSLTCLLLLYLFSINIGTSFSQNRNTIDSLLRLAAKETSEKNKALLYSNVAEEFHFNMPDSAIKYCYVGMAYSIKNKDTSDLAYFHTFLGVLFKNIALYDSAIFHLNQSIVLSKLDGFEKGVAANLNNMGQVFLLKGDYDQALNSYYHSLQIFEKHKDTLNIGELHSNIGGLLVKINELDAAETHFKISTKQYKLAGAKLQEAWILYDMGNLKMKKGKLDSALVFFKESALVWNKYNRIKDYQNCMLRIGEIMMVQKKYNYAEMLFINSQKQFEEINYIKGVSESLMLLGRVEFLEKNYNKSLENLNKSLNLSTQLQLNSLEMDTYNDLYNCYKALNQFDKALMFHEKFQKLKDSIFSEDKNKLLAEYQTKLNLLNKEIFIKQLEDSTQRQILLTENISLENKQKQKSIYFLIFGILIILAFSYLLYRRNKVNMKLNKELNLSLKEREVLIREVHHRVKNNLQIISSLINLQSENTDGIDPKEILKISQSRIEAMSMIHENLYKSSKLSEINFNNYIENLCNYIEASFSLSEKGIYISLEIEQVQIEIDQLVPCGLIINELVTNSIKHAFVKQNKKKILIKCFVRGEKIKIEYSDNGIGLCKDFNIKQSKSLGLRLAMGLAIQLKSTLAIENRSGFYATFEFLKQQK